jgi:hypothetical protein
VNESGRIHESEAAGAVKGVIKPEMAKMPPLYDVATKTENAQIAEDIHGLDKKDNRIRALHLGMLGTEAETILVGRTLEPQFLSPVERVTGLNVSPEVEQDELALARSRLADRKPLAGDLARAPIVPANCDEAIERLAVFDRDHELLLTHERNHLASLFFPN